MTIITHSEFLVEQLESVCEFFNMLHPEMKCKEWIHRDIRSTNFEEFEDRTQKLYEALLPKKEV